MRLLAVALAASVALAAGCDSSTSSGNSSKPRVDRFDSGAAWRLLKRQVALGPRPAGSRASRRLARRLRRLLPRGRYQRVPGGLRNVVGKVPGRSRRYVVVGAHYDTKDIPGFVGANDSASGTAVVTQLARSIRPRRLRSTLVFVLFDGEESPRGTPDADFEEEGLRGSKVAARRYRRAKAMVLLDFVGDRRLRIPREDNSSIRLWRRLRSAARRVGAGRAFPADTAGGVSDDHIPFIDRGVPSIDLIDFDFPCFHRRCDDLSAVSERSLDAVGETVYELLRRW
jgi:glutaminyl-peptide cyclotransferase